MQFQKYQHIERLGTQATEGILDGTVYVFSKLDGTNTSVYLNDNGEVEVASRKRVLTYSEDNRGVRKAILSDKRYKDYLAMYPTHRLYGEWLVPHTLRVYNDDAWCQFYAFDVMDGDRYLTYEEYVTPLAIHAIKYIPLIAKLENPTVEDVAALQDKCTFQVKDGSLGEGIVVKRYDFVNKFGRTNWAKLVRPVAKAATKLQTPLKTESVEGAIVEGFLSPMLIEKELAKLVYQNGSWDKRLIGSLIANTWYAFISEETFNFVKQFKNPTINFRLLNALVVHEIKARKPELFA